MTRLRAAAIGSRCAAFALFALVTAAVHAQDRFVISSDGQEVTDSTTKLVWRRCGEGQSWDGKTCSGKPWRIPSREELVSLYDAKVKRAPHIDGSVFPKATNGPFWAIRAGTDDDLNAWLVNFRNGRVSGYAGQTTFPLRLVRAP